MHLLALTSAHCTAALRFAMLASLPSPTTDERAAREHAETEARLTFARVVAHVPDSASELRLKADYLASRLAMGDQLDGHAMAKLLASLSRFNLPHHA
jgi:hypothetical protein